MNKKRTNGNIWPIIWLLKNNMNEVFVNKAILLCSLVQVLSFVCGFICHIDMLCCYDDLHFNITNSKPQKLLHLVHDLLP